MTPQEKKNKVIITLAEAYESKNTNLTDRVEAILIPNVQVLPAPLQEVLNSWGTTPIEEPAFAKLLIEKGTTAEQIKEVSAKDLDLDLYNALDIATLAAKVRSKIMDKIDEEGKYKSTPLIDKCKLPKTSQIKTLKQMVIDKKEEAELNSFIYISTGIEELELNLTEWEADLIREMTISYINGVDQDTLGNYIDRTPFARYLGN
jgi:hypothetical protein